MAPLQAQMPLEGSYTFDKRLAPMANGVTMEMNASYAQIEALLDQKFKAAGAKVKKERKDLYLAQSTVIPSISGRTLDYYYRLEEPSKNQPRPRLTLFLSLGNQNFLSSDMYPQEIEAAKAFLANLDAEARRAAIQAEVTAQTAALNELLKKQASLKEEQTTLEEEKAKLEAALQKNAGAQAQNAEAQQQVQAKVTAEQAKLQKLQQQLEQIQQIGTGQN
ncbi:MAG: hypothetical protein D6722_26655 [Bacteroidetes bacterium]|nr:MAG: hypothetical protein D6722_26655 [Bacteroidota bacterium]